MDPVCHTLTGVALGEAGLKRRSGLAMATLIIGANFPDIDVVAVPLGMNLEFRRGWTHGVLAMLVLPFVLTGIMLLWDQLVRRRGGRMPPAPVVPSQLLLLSMIGVLSHPALDFLNTYGVRLLMPVSERWFRGDALFIVDPWVLLVLAGGILVARLGWRRAPETRVRLPVAARAALALVTLYALVMLDMSARGREHVRDVLARPEPARTARQIMVAPVPVHPLRRDVVIDTREQFLIGRMLWSAAGLVPRSPARPEFAITDSIPRNADHPAVAAAARTREGAAFLRWSRFPYFRVEEREDQIVVRMADLRYARNAGGGWATRTIVVGRGPPAASD